MKTVQQWIQALNDNRLIDTFCAEHPTNYGMIVEADLTLGHIREMERKHFQEFLARMKEMPAEQLPESDAYVFFGCKAYQEGSVVLDVYMCKMADLKGPGKPETYSWMLEDQTEMLGSLVADTELTTSEIYSVISNILYEATFFGYTQQEIENERKKLDDALSEAQDEVERGDTVTLDEFRKAHGLEPKHPDKDGEKLLQKITCAEHEYNQFCLAREVALIREQLGLSV